MTLTLEQYAEKHNYTVLKEYTTYGDNVLNHRRAIVQHNETGEKHYLYFDRSTKRRTLKQQKKALEIYNSGGIPPIPSVRGWRNTTLDNRRRVERNNKRHEEVNCVRS